MRGLRIILSVLLFGAGAISQNPCTGAGCVQQESNAGDVAWDYIPGLNDKFQPPQQNVWVCNPLDCKETSCRFAGLIEVSNSSGSNRYIYDHTGTFVANVMTGSTVQFPVDVKPGCGETNPERWIAWDSDDPDTRVFKSDSWMSCSVCVRTPF